MLLKSITIVSNNNNSKMKTPLSWKTSSSSSSLFRRYIGALLIVVVLALLSLVVVVDAGAVLGHRRLEKDNEQGRSIEISNMSGRKCDLFWVNVFKKPEQFVPQFIEDGVTVGISYGADKSISSFIGHEFELRELPSKRTKQCIFEECRSVRIKVSDRQDQKVTIERDFTVTIQDEHERSYSKADDMYIRCQTKINSDALSPLEFIDAMTTCMEDEVNQKLMKVQEERSFHKKVHRSMASDLVPFTCGDVNQTQSREVQNSTWSYSGDGVSYKIKKLHELPTSSIFIVEDFITADYCDALKVYRNDDDDTDNKHVPMSAAFEGTKQGDMLMGLLNKIYELIMDRMKWDDLNVDGDILFKYMKDEIGIDTPTHLCDGTEEVAKAIIAIETGQPKPCQIPGGVPVKVSTKHIHMVDVEKKDDSKEDEIDGQQKRELADVFLFCDEPEQKILGGLHFPFARIHITPKPGKLVVAVNRNTGVETNELDGYVNEYHLCPNHEVYVHTVSESVSKGDVAAGVGGDEL
mmetsp:Transcript_54206/g.60608  ORF Transcript_54206/g.60608 Transcript_54206/m.60608 type:complete len:521 (-) Transcript_54206:142-1704(-)